MKEVSTQLHQSFLEESDFSFLQTPETLIAASSSTVIADKVRKNMSPASVAKETSPLSATPSSANMSYGLGGFLVKV